MRIEAPRGRFHPPAEQLRLDDLIGRRYADCLGDRQRQHGMTRRQVQLREDIPQQVLGDQRIIEAVQRGELGDLTRDDSGETNGNLVMKLKEAQYA